MNKRRILTSAARGLHCLQTLPGVNICAARALLWIIPRTTVFWSSSRPYAGLNVHTRGTLFRFRRGEDQCSRNYHRRWWHSFDLGGVSARNAHCSPRFGVKAALCLLDSRNHRSSFLLPSQRNAQPWWTPTVMWKIIILAIILGLTSVLTIILTVLYLNNNLTENFNQKINNNFNHNLMI